VDLFDFNHIYEIKFQEKKLALFCKRNFGLKILDDNFEISKFKNFLLDEFLRLSSLLSYKLKFF
jgi:hypothetical protein